MFIKKIRAVFGKCVGVAWAAWLPELYIIVVWVQYVIWVVCYSLDSVMVCFCFGHMLSSNVL